MCFPTDAAFRGSVEVYAVICIVFSYRCGVSWVSGGVCCNMYCVFLQMRRFVGQWRCMLYNVLCFPTDAAFRGSVEVYAVICIVFSYRCGVSWVSGGVCCNMYCVFLQMRRFVGQWRCML